MNIHALPFQSDATRLSFASLLTKLGYIQGSFAVIFSFESAILKTFSIFTTLNNSNEPLRTNHHQHPCAPIWATAFFQETNVAKAKDVREKNLRIGLFFFSLLLAGPRFDSSINLVKDFCSFFLVCKLIGDITSLCLLVENLI